LGAGATSAAAGAAAEGAQQVGLGAQQVGAGAQQVGFGAQQATGLGAQQVGLGAQQVTGFGAQHFTGLQQFAANVSPPTKAATANAIANTLRLMVEPPNDVLKQTPTTKHSWDHTLYPITIPVQPRFPPVMASATSTFHRVVSLKDVLRLEFIALGKIFPDYLTHALKVS